MLATVAKVVRKQVRCLSAWHTIEAAVEVICDYEILQYIWLLWETQTVCSQQVQCV